MNYKIRKMQGFDKDTVIQMMRVFYASPAVFTNGSEEIFEADVDNCIGDSPFLEGFVIEGESEIMGYAMVAKSFSTEFGKSCIWIEDIYIKEKYRGCGLGSEMLRFISESYDNCIFRLEVEEENESAIRVYRKSGFSPLPYMEMKK